VLIPANGETRTRADLRTLVEQARSVRNILHGLHSRYTRLVSEQAAIAGVLRADIFADATVATEAARYIAKRLDALAEETERGWQGTFVESTRFQFQGTVWGV